MGKRIRQIKCVVVRFAGDSGDGMRLVGARSAGHWTAVPSCSARWTAPRTTIRYAPSVGEGGTARSLAHIIAGPDTWHVG